MTTLRPDMSIPLPMTLGLKRPLVCFFPSKDHCFANPGGSYFYSLGLAAVMLSKDLHFYYRRSQETLDLIENSAYERRSGSEGECSSFGLL